MNLIFLVNGGGAKILLQSIPYPDGADHKIGPYGNRDIYTVTVSFEERTVRAATSLANYRDQVLALEKNKKASKRNIKCLCDDASRFFCAKLYPRFSEFETSLRTVVVIALCADRDSFDSEVSAPSKPSRSKSSVRDSSPTTRS